MGDTCTATEPKKKAGRRCPEVVVVVQLERVPWTADREAARRQAMEALIAIVRTD